MERLTFKHQRRLRRGDPPHLREAISQRVSGQLVRIGEPNNKLLMVIIGEPNNGVLIMVNHIESSLKGNPTSGSMWRKTLGERLPLKMKPSCISDGEIFYG